MLPFFVPHSSSNIKPKRKKKKESHFLGWRFYGYKVFEKNTILPIGGWRFFSKPEGLDLYSRKCGLKQAALSLLSDFIFLSSSIHYMFKSYNLISGVNTPQERENTIGKG
jgi:hypothetical protein